LSFPLTSSTRHVTARLCSINLYDTIRPGVFSY
jgi:hypothetical protein